MFVFSWDGFFHLWELILKFIFRDKFDKNWIFHYLRETLIKVNFRQRMNGMISILYFKCNTFKTIGNLYIRNICEKILINDPKFLGIAFGVTYVTYKLFLIDCIIQIFVKFFLWRVPSLERMRNIIHLNSSQILFK